MDSPKLNGNKSTTINWDVALSAAERKRKFVEAASNISVLTIAILLGVYVGFCVAIATTTSYPTLNVTQ